MLNFLKQKKGIRLEHLFSPNWRESVLDRKSTLFDALKNLSDSGSLIACFLDDQNRLEGIITDSDVRKALINGKKLEENAITIANFSPTTCNYQETAENLKYVAATNRIHEIPLVDEEKKLRDIFIVSLREERVEIINNDYDQKIKAPRQNAMFILAGGLGTRLSSIMKDRPKPLAMIGEKPIIAIVIEQAVEAGIRNFYISVNYMAEKIKDFLEKSAFNDLNIHIIHEEKRLGTAGSLSLIPQDLQSPLLVCNSDILTNVNFERILLQHEKNQAALTCAVRPHCVSVPFGVFDIMNDVILDIREKPEALFLVNAAIYVLDPKVIKLIPTDSYYDMPDLIKKIIHNKMKISPFYLHEYWMDIGKPEDYERANLDFSKIFR